MQHAPLGLRNLGATCYLNTALQSIASSERLVAALSTELRREGAPTLRSLLAQHVVRPPAVCDTALPTDELVEAVRMHWDPERTPDVEYDAAEAWRELVELVVPSQRNGTTAQIVACARCRRIHSNRRDGVGYTLPLETERAGVPLSARRSMRQFQARGEEFLRACACGHATATARVKIVELPDIVMVESRGASSIRLGDWDTLAVHKGELNPLYLVSIVCYHRTRGRTGHYTSIVRRGRAWFLCDDSNVQRLHKPPEFVDNVRALCYERRQSLHFGFPASTSRAHPLRQDCGALPSY